MNFHKMEKNAKQVGVDLFAAYGSFYPAKGGCEH